MQVVTATRNRQKTVQETEVSANNSSGSHHQQQVDAPLDNDSDSIIDSGSPSDLFFFDCSDGNSNEEAMLTHDDETINHDPSPGLSKQSEKFRDYVARATRDNKPLKPNWIAAIELTSLMDTKGGAIELFHAVLDWHVRHLEGNQSEKVSASNLHNTLIERYGMEEVMPYEVEVDLQ